MRKSKLWRGLTAVFAVLLTILLPLTSAAFNYTGMINDKLGVQTSRIEVINEGEVTDLAYYPSDYGDVNNFTMMDLENLLADEEAHIVSEMEEGAVLLKNNGALPLLGTEGKNISLLGYASYDPLYKPNSGGASVNMSRLVTLKDALENEGYKINPTLWNMYEENGSRRGGSFGSISYNTGEYEPQMYTDAMKSSFAQYGDAAIVVIARSGGEGRDLPMADDENNNGGSNLALHPNEIALLEMIQENKTNGNFNKVIALINSGYAMELEWLDEYDIDACLWIGGTGVTGFTGVVNLLTGAANPSGRLVNIYAADSLSSPAAQNAGDFTFTNASEIEQLCSDPSSQTTKYIVEAEGVYIGYRYYETRYEDYILGQGNADGNAGIFASSGGSWNYGEEVTFPFGYGLSYTTFKQTLNSVVENEDNTFTAAVTVENTGSAAGREVVQLYVQTPYTEENILNKVEKSAIQLVGFGKTDVLQPQEEQQITITVDKYLLASYDNTTQMDGLTGGYILDQGDYYFAIGSDSHGALNNVLAAKGAQGMIDHEGNAVTPDADPTVSKWVLETKDNDTYKYSEYTANRVSNQFDDIDINYWQEDAVTYLTRSNWQETFPEAIRLSATAEMITAIDGYTYEKPEDAPSVTAFKQGMNNGLNIIDMKDLDYEDPLWEDFLNQLTIDEMAEITLDQLGTSSIEKVNKAAQTNTDGPDGAQRSYMIHDESGTLVSSNISATAYPNEVVLASAWSTELLAKRGYFLGEDALITRTSQLWSPGANIHRTPFSGRNFEYYSEDSYMSYLCSGIEAKAMTEKGVNAAIKHFAGNDQETNRNGVCTFMTEQAYRQNSLRGFEGAFTIGKTKGTMTAFNRLGCTYAGASDAMQNKVLRDEWGFQGVCITDAANASAIYIHTIESLTAGSDMFCMSPNTRATEIVTKINREDDGYVLQCLREANHNFYYAFANSLLMNGTSSNTRVVAITPWWHTAIIAVDVIFALLTVVCLGLYVVSRIRGKKTKEV